ncbi:MAG: CopY family transcriptional regulator [Hadesarchaea archaeon]|nr:MAG: CopY family transcriptional regulator [Hadesarchaea archaeon]
MQVNSGLFLVVNLFSWTEYKPYKQGVQTVLSPLESEVMGIMWREKRATVRTVHTRLKSKRPINRSKVNAVMSSLRKRGLLASSVSKGRGGLKYVYKVKVSRKRFEREVVGKVVDSLLESYGKTSKKLMRENMREK